MEIDIPKLLQDKRTEAVLGAIERNAPAVLGLLIPLGSQLVAGIMVKLGLVKPGTDERHVTLLREIIIELKGIRDDLRDLRRP